MPFIFSKAATAGGNTTNTNATAATNTIEDNICKTSGQYVVTLKGDIMDDPELKNATGQSLIHQFKSQGIIIPKEDEQKIKQGVFVIESANSTVIQKVVNELRKDPRIQSVEENKCVEATDFGNNRTK
jgi:hypothetical protein